MVSAISCMLLGPMSLSRIHPRRYVLIPTNMREMTMVVKATKVEAADETKVANNRIVMGPDSTATALTTNIESV